MACFAARPTTPGSILLLGMYAYALQIYCDFSAYTDIAIGIANLLGYQFPQNFNQPYRALSVQDFWRRWHITLSTWLRDYLYIPLGGNRGGSILTYRNILVTMTLGGLWHGASVNFVIWGILHGAALVIERMLGVTGEGGHRRIPPAISWFITFHFVCITWVFFRSPTLEGAQTYLSTLVSGDVIFSTTVTPLVVAMLVLGALTQIIPQPVVRAISSFATTAPRSPVKVAVPFVVIFLVAVAAPGGVPPFIYFQF